MGLVEFFTGRRFALSSALPPAEIVRLINRADDARFTPSGGRIRGGALLNRLNIYVQPFGWDNHAGPRLRGTLRPSVTGTTLDLTFGAAWFQYLLWPVWYLGLLAVGLPILASSSFEANDAVVLFFATAPIALQWFLLRSAEEHFAQMLEFLQFEAQATPVFTPIG